MFHDSSYCLPAILKVVPPVVTVALESVSMSSYTPRANLLAF